MEFKIVQIFRTPGIVLHTVWNLVLSFDSISSYIVTNIVEVGFYYYKMIV